MTIKHHISDELLLDYAAGGLEESWSVAVATHLALCPGCRRRLSAMEAAGGVMIEAIVCEEVSPEAENASWASILKRVEASSDAKPAARAKQPHDFVSYSIPEPLRSYIGGDLDKLKWKPLGLGAYHLPIPTSDKAISMRLLRIPAGKPVPEHSHGGRELTLVLKGSFKDETGKFGPGDFEETDETVNHQPVAEEGEDCICLAVTDAPLRFRSRIVRMIQPLLGI